MRRREFIKTSGGVALTGALVSGVQPDYTYGQSGSSVSASEIKSSTVRVQDNVVIIDTHTQTATITDGFLTSLKNKRTGEEYISTFDRRNHSALQIIYRGTEVVNVDEKTAPQTSTVPS